MTDTNHKRMALRDGNTSLGCRWAVVLTGDEAGV